MRLSIECNGCKATLTSGSSLTALPSSSKEKPAKLKKQDIVIEKPAARDVNSARGKRSLSSYFSSEDDFSTTAAAAPKFSSETSSKYCNNSCSSSSSSNGKMQDCRKKEKVKVERGVAVVEQSSDPYGDFRRSMVEMIMARRKRKLSSDDLNRLLRCYLSLNQPQHHPVILKAFSDLFVGGPILM